MRMQARESNCFLAQVSTDIGKTLGHATASIAMIQGLPPHQAAPRVFAPNGAAWPTDEREQVLSGQRRAAFVRERLAEAKHAEAELLRRGDQVSIKRAETISAEVKRLEQQLAADEEQQG